ncbi:MAG: EAL domain-containing protein [Steroidobacteraceae bacterium]
MKQPTAVPMIVLTRHQDQVEAINKALRNAGHPVHLTWLPDARELGDALTQIAPEMIIYFADEDVAGGDAVLDLRARFAPEVPVVVVRERLDEATITESLELGAQDAVTLGQVVRLQRVVSRELEAFRLQRALHGTLSAADQYRQQLQAIMAGSADAIAHVQEGIVVDANPAWLELFGFQEADGLVGSPLMDQFEPESHAGLKGALLACLQGKWSDHALKANVHSPDGSSVSLEFVLTRAEFDGEPCVRLCVPARSRDRAEVEQRLEDAVKLDPSTGLMHRTYFLELLRDRLTTPVKAGMRGLVYVEPDKLDAAIAEIGVLAAEEFLTAFGSLLREQLQAGDVAGRMTGNGFMVLVERGAARDVEAWAEHVIHKVGSNVFAVGAKSLSATATAGIGLISGSIVDVADAAADAYRAARRGHELGGNRVHSLEHTEKLRRLQDMDALWVRQIKSALMENRFRLVQQPIASLVGDESGMFDVLVRMLDEQGHEVLPSEFIAAAERKDLMKNIDRWIIGASLSFCASRRPAALFVRLSRDSVTDDSLPAWLMNQLRTHRVEPARVVFQVAEGVAAENLNKAIVTKAALHKLGFRFAIESIGSGRDPEGQITHLKPDFVKIDGSLMQGLAADQLKQQRVRKLVDVARNAGAVTIGERVEDANTMAVLWQLGVEFIQGYFVNAPEEIVLG